jgi:hypothetical protein
MNSSFSLPDGTSSECAELCESVSLRGGGPATRASGTIRIVAGNNVNRGARVRAESASDPQTFLANLKNLGVVLSEALLHFQGGRDEFAGHANGEQLRQFERLVTEVRVSAERMEREFNFLEYLVARRPRRPV